MKRRPSPETVISKQRIISDLENMGIRKGDHVALGISLKSIGYVEGGPEAFIDALLESVGPDGTIMMNTHTKFFRPTSRVKGGKTRYIFDFRSTKAVTGIVPETFRHRGNAIRSRHPTSSVAALGKHAKYLTEDHDEHTANSFLPYSRLADIDGKYLAIGIGDRLVGFRHEAQYNAGLLGIVPWKWSVNYRDRSSNISIFTTRNINGCVRQLPVLVSYLREKGLVKDGKIGLAGAVLTPAREALETMTDLLKTRPELNLCDYVFCVWCRELEWRMRLYKRIRNPRYFQKNILVIHLIALINWFRKKDNLFIVQAERYVGRSLKYLIAVIKHR